MKRIFALVLIFSFITSMNAQYQYVEQIDILPESYKDDFTSIYSTIKEHYTHVKSKKINLDALYQKTALAIREIKVKEEYLKSSIRYFSNLNNMHPLFFQNDYGIMASASLLENRLLINEMQGIHLREAGIQAKDEIISIDGLPSLEWRQRKNQYTSYFTDKGNLIAVTRKVFNDKLETTRVDGISSKSGVQSLNVQFDNPVD